LENGMSKHTKNILSQAGNDTQGLACSGVTRHHHFRATRHLLDLGATRLKERPSLFLAKNTYIPCIIIREPRRADGRILHHSLTFFDSFLCNTFLLFSINTFSGHFLFGFIGLPPGMVCTSSEGNKLDARHGILARNFTFACFKDQFVEEAHARGACQSFGGRMSPANSRIMNFTFCQTTFHITSENVT
jgi:hypothetical protein